MKKNISDTLTFFATCNNNYNNFILPYIYFANSFNPNSYFEIITCDKISQEILNGINYLQTFFKNPNIKIKYFPTNIHPR